MANTLLIKRGLKSNFASLTLKSGELGVALDTQELYVGDDNGTVKPIKGIGTQLAIPRTIGLTTDVTGQGQFDGSSDVSIAVELAKTGVVAGTYTKVTVDEKGRVTTGTNISIEDIGDIGTAAKKDVGTAEGNIPVLGADGRLPDSVIPHIAITDTYTAASKEEMLGLEAQVGDVCVRTDESKTYILAQEPASEEGNWQEILTPTDVVTSVNGKQGAVVIGIDDIEGLRDLIDSKTSVYDGLDSNDGTIALSAKQGKYLNENKIGINDTIDGGEF